MIALRMKNLRIAGKVGEIPKYRSVPQLEGHTALYKEELYKNVYSFKLNAFGVDCAAWDKAFSLGARGLVIYCKDRKMLITIKDEQLRIRADLGDGVQYRVPISQCKIYSGAEPIPMGWTNKVIDL